jgi:hypothetical protein
MKKPSSKIRNEIARLQEQLKHAETREAERIGRIALRAGIGEFEIEDMDLLAALEELAKRFRAGIPGTDGKKGAGETVPAIAHPEALASGSVPGGVGKV